MLLVNNSGFTLTEKFSWACANSHNTWNSSVFLGCHMWCSCGPAMSSHCSPPLLLTLSIRRYITLSFALFHSWSQQNFSYSHLFSRAFCCCLPPCSFFLQLQFFFFRCVPPFISLFIEWPGLKRTTIIMQFQPPAMCRVANHQTRLPRATSSLWHQLQAGVRRNRAQNELGKTFFSSFGKAA